MQIEEIADCFFALFEAGNFPQIPCGSCRCRELCDDAYEKSRGENKIAG